MQAGSLSHHMDSVVSGFELPEIAAVAKAQQRPKRRTGSLMLQSLSKA